jgi:hypothetical protein
MATADLSTHPLLSPRAKLIDPDELTAHVLLAETLLGVDQLALKADDADQDKVDGAIVLQVNYQVESGVEGFLMQEARRGARHNIYRGRNRLQYVHRLALEAIRQLKRTRGLI